LNLKNYTSTVPVSRTISKIEEILAETGAKAIAKTYENTRVAAITFQLAINGKDFLIRLPADPEAVYRSLAKEVIRPREGTLERLREQADRTAWKIQQDWLEIELTKMRLQQTEPLQAFLSYIWNGNQTYYEALKERKFRGLLGTGEDPEAQTKRAT